MKNLKAFTLLELLVVVAIIALLTGLVIGGSRGGASHATLSGQGDRVASLISLARQSAMGRSTLTAIVMITSTEVDVGYRAVSLWQLPPRTDGNPSQSSDWRQVTKWEVLRPGTIFQHPTNAEMDNPTLSIPPPPLPTVTYQGTTIPPAGYRYKLFLPSGGLLGDQSGIITIVEGAVNGGNIQLTNRAPGGGPANFYKVVVVSATGHVVIERP